MFYLVSFPKTLLLTWVILTGATFLSCPFLGSTWAAVEIDFIRPPNYQQLAIMTGSEKISPFRDSLGNALAASWKGGESGRTGSCAEDSYARWVDIYQWLDLLESDESVVMRRWLSRHLRVVEEQTLQGKNLQIALNAPGAPLNHASSSPELLERVLADSSMSAQIMGKLVAQPFTPHSGLLADRLEPEFIAVTLSDPDFLKRWSESFSQDDFAPKVLLNLQAIWKAHRADWHEFQSLALALAVVKDQPAPEYWPHHQVAQADVPREDAPPEELFAQWVEAFRTGKLRMDPRALEVSDLKFVIDAPLRYTEFASIRGNPMLAYQNPPKAFESISYDQGRVLKNVYDWPWGSYLMSSIKARGGICVDQAYYAAIAGKALGIPTIFFSGQGRDGGHSWIGYLKGPKQWDLNVARYASQNYGTGEGLDPQSWTPITDHDLELLTLHFGNHDAINAARRDLIIAANFRRKGDLASEGRALQSALQISPENPATWDAREEWLVRSGASIAHLKAHHQNAVIQFSRFNNFKAQHEQALVELALRSGEKQGAELLAEQIVNENRKGMSAGARTDLGARAIWSMISVRLQAKDFAGAIEQFEHQLHLLGQDGGGDFFYAVIAPLSLELIQSNHQAEALRVLKEAYQTLKPAKASILDHDFRKLWTAAGGASSMAVSLPNYL